MNPLADYFVDGCFLVGFYPFSRNRCREQLFEEIIDGLEEDQIQPILCREPLARFSPGEHPPDDKHGKRSPEEIYSKIEG
jgi:hypothetical protein